MPAYTYRTVLPHPALRDYIACYWVDDKEGMIDRPMPRRIMPDGNAHLIFYLYGTHSDVLDGPAPASACRLRFVGARSIYLDIDQRRRARTLIVRFRPGGAFPFFPIPAVEFLDQGFPLDAFWGSESALLLERLAQTPDAAAQIGIIESALRRKLRAAPPLDPVVQGAVRHMQAAPEGAALKPLAATLGLSERHLRTRFRRAVGLSPKRCARILRLQHAMRRAAHAPAPAWPQLALSTGFFDQAHLIHECQALLGETPTAFMQRL